MTTVQDHVNNRRKLEAIKTEADHVSDARRRSIPYRAENGKPAMFRCDACGKFATIDGFPLSHNGTRQRVCSLCKGSRAAATNKKRKEERALEMERLRRRAIKVSGDEAQMVMDAPLMQTPNPRPLSALLVRRSAKEMVLKAGELIRSGWSADDVLGVAEVMELVGKNGGGENA